MFSLFAYSLAFAISLPLLVLAVESLCSLLPSRRIQSGQRGTAAVIIPAHNEEFGIAATIANIRPQLAAGDRLLVIADNCSDRTAEIARECKATVVERSDATNRGKGFALSAGLKYLRALPKDQYPDVVIVVDADCKLTESTLGILVARAMQSRRPQQACYLMHAGATKTPTRNLSAFAFLTKNFIRPRGLSRLGLPVPLNGSGMAFPWQTLENIELGTSEIVEDLELGLQLVMQRCGPQFCEAARVDSYFPNSEDAAHRQRQRWEHGFIRQMAQKLPVLLREGVSGNLQAIAAGLDLLVPPLSLLVLGAALSGATLTTYGILADDRGPLLVFLTSASIASVSLFAIWYRFGRQTLSLAEILWIPAYAGSKISMYLAIPFRPQQAWNRTKREDGS